MPFQVKKVYTVNNKSFSNPNELVEYAKLLLDEDLLKFENFCMKLMHNNSDLDVIFEAWLIVHGKEKQIIKWQNQNE